jgi:T5orf172 domain
MIYTLYLVECENHYKIGHTNNLENRLKSLNNYFHKYGKDVFDEFDNVSKGDWCLVDKIMDEQYTTRGRENFCHKTLHRYLTQSRPFANTKKHTCYERYHKNSTVLKLWKCLKDNPFALEALGDVMCEKIDDLNWLSDKGFNDVVKYDWTAFASRKSKLTHL